MKHYLQSILIVLIAMIISAILLTGVFYGISLIVMGADVVREMGEIILVK